MFKPRDIIIPAAYTYPEGALRVHADHGAILEAFPEGGGPVYRFDAAARARYAFRVVSPWELETPWKLSRFDIDGGPSFPGWHCGRRWNGWACPVFDRVTFEDILKWADMPYTYDEKTDTFHVEDPYNDPWKASGSDKCVPGFTVYSFDGWCWDETRDPEPIEDEE